MFFKKKKMQAKNLKSRVNTIEHGFKFLSEQITAQSFLQAKNLINYNNNNVSAIIQNIQLAEFKVSSQWGDDGIIQFLVDYLAVEHKTFIEFGVSDYKEANTRFLLMNNNWVGLVMDGSESNVNAIIHDDIYWKYQLKAIHTFITRENINKLISDNNFNSEIGLLHIDLDGNDYWVWEAITTVSPVIAILEYNSAFGTTNPWSIPYQPDFDRTKYHYSNLYFGASILSLCDLAETKGYSFIGCNSNGNNAYFVRKDRMKDLKALAAEQGYVLSRFRESRDTDGQLTYINGEDRLRLLKGMEVFNTRDQKIEII